MYTGLLAPPPQPQQQQQQQGGGGGGGGGGGAEADASSEAAEIRALMQMHGVAASSMGSHSEAKHLLSIVLPYYTTSYTHLLWLGTVRTDAYFEARACVRGVRRTTCWS